MPRLLKWERGLDPTELLDFVIDWSEDLGADVISTSSWAFDSGNEDTVLIKSSPAATSTTTTIWFTAGTPGQKYKITNTITTSGGRTFERSAQIAVSQR
jgi:hypothetical protein